jgi:hypothetical protein
MPELILSGFVKTEAGPEEFAVYRHLNHTRDASSHFTCVDHKFTDIGWGTLNASGGLPAYAHQHKVYYETLMHFEAGVGYAKPFPVDELSHASDVAALAL